MYILTGYHQVLDWNSNAVGHGLHAFQSVNQALALTVHSSCTMWFHVATRHIVCFQSSLHQCPSANPLTSVLLARLYSSPAPWPSCTTSWCNSTPVHGGFVHLHLSKVNVHMYMHLSISPSRLQATAHQSISAVETHFAAEQLVVEAILSVAVSASNLTPTSKPSVNNEGCLYRWKYCTHMHNYDTVLIATHKVVRAWSRVNSAIWLDNWSSACTQIISHCGLEWGRTVETFSWCLYKADLYTSGSQYVCPCWNMSVGDFPRLKLWK